MSCKPICYVYYKKCPEAQPPPPRRYRGLPWNTTVTDDNTNVSEGFDIHYSYQTSRKEDLKPAEIYIENGISYASAKPVSIPNTILLGIPIFFSYFSIHEDAINSLYEVRFTFTSFHPPQDGQWFIYFNQEIIANFNKRGSFEGKFKTTLTQTRNEIRILRNTDVGGNDLIAFKLQWFI
jgi:hypothetical protein